MDDLVRAYFNGVHNCEVIEENFEYLGERRFRIINEAVDAAQIKNTIANGAKKAGSESEDLTGRQVEDLRHRQRNKIKKMTTEEYEIIFSYLLENKFVNTITSAEAIVDSMSDNWINSILDEKFVKVMDYKRKGPDHRTHFPYTRPQNLGKNRNNPNFQYLPKFSKTRLNQNDKKIDPYYSGNRKRKEERRKGVGGFRE